MTEEGIPDYGWRSNLIGELESAWRDEQYTDLVITTCDGDVPVHKVVMAASSPYFRLDFVSMPGKKKA